MKLLPYQEKALADLKRALADATFQPWDLARNVLGTGLQKGELVVLGGPSKKRPWLLYDVTIHRTHADGSKTTESYKKGRAYKTPADEWFFFDDRGNRVPIGKDTAMQMSQGEDMKDYGAEVTQPEKPPVPPEEVQCPRMVNIPMEKGTRCYLCARLLDYFFERTQGDYSKICSRCVWDHLGYEAVPDGQGQLRRRPEEKPLR